MSLARVWNDGDHEYVEEFKEVEIRIPAKKYVEMDRYEAAQFMGQFVAFKVLGNGQATHEKRLRIEKFPETTPQKQEIKCQLCLGKFDTATELALHSKSEHADQIIQEPEVKDGKKGQK